MHQKPAESSTSRRGFLQAGVAGLAAAGVVRAAQSGDTPKNDAGIPLRPFGRHSEELVTMICLGGHHVGRNLSEAEDVKLIQMAVDEGVTFLDNAWDYHDGGSEERMGKALEQGKLRDKVFLMTKVCARDAKTAREQLEQSLQRLRTDHLDLWQFHEINYDNDPDWIFAEDGALSVALKAREEGKIRYLGFTGHKDPRIHLKMLGMPFEEWDSVQMPLNVMDGTYRSFQNEVLPVLDRRGIAPIGMKSLGGAGKIVSEAGVPVDQALRYVLSLPITTLVSGMESPEILRQNLEIVRDFTPMTPDERAALERDHLRVAGDGRFEQFKSAKTFDGPYHQQQHGFEPQDA
ncbi:aldo/keto reductase [Tautonia plasticadhaerens]|uniref:General stress protein 69 n=1 Tax=Tautonia plasticadhaerens TaxID=2527974 RepID=A0A518GXU4_9BACT|nr:aldo/keto reductase [Tautonia plasticadhaerens]QDV33407.1 General stress protein 69 [Tautonia plasticadhaerens]